MPRSVESLGHFLLFRIIMAPNIANHSDLKHLRLLSIFYYILATLSALTGCLLMGFALAGVAVMAGAVDGVPRDLAIFAGLLLTVIESALGLFVWIMCVLEMTTARSLARHKHYHFTFIMACIELINIPFGTTLAVFTIIVLSRPSVRSLYEGKGDADPRLAALDEFDRDGEAEDVTAPVPKNPGDESIKEQK